MAKDEKGAFGEKKMDKNASKMKFSRHRSGSVSIVDMVSAGITMKEELEHIAAGTATEDDLRGAYTTSAHQMTHEELARSFGTDLEKGLNQDTVDSLLLRHGPNALSEAVGTPWWIHWLLCVFGGFFNVLLWVGSLLSIGAYIADPKKEGTNLYIGIVLAA
eukprot:964805_1